MLRLAALACVVAARLLCTAAAPPQPSPALVRVRIRGRQVVATAGETVRSALLRRGLTPHNGRSQAINCRGLGTCGTCAVQVCPSSTARLVPAAHTRAEAVRLRLPPHRPPLGAGALRLACQCRLAEPVEGEGVAGAPPPVLTLIKHRGFWGSEAADHDDDDDGDGGGGNSALPLGPLEFVLDRGARPPPPERGERGGSDGVVLSLIHI